MLETEELVVRLPSGSFTLTDPYGEEVFADIAYQPGAGAVTLTPVEPLLPETSYTATIEGLEDVWATGSKYPCDEASPSAARTSWRLHAPFRVLL